MKKQKLLLILKIITTGYIVWFLWHYIKFIQNSSFMTLYNNECTFLDFLPLSYLFLALLAFCLTFQILTFFTKNRRILRNYLMVSLNVFILLSVHNLLQIIFNNKSGLLLERSLLLNPIIPLVSLVLIYWFTKGQNVDQPVDSKPMATPTTTARIIFFVVFFISILAVLFYHSFLIYGVFSEHGRLISEYNCGDYPARPGTIPGSQSI